MGNNPASNIDPMGNYFFGLIGSTKEQRQAATTFAANNNGLVKDASKKSVHVDFSAGTYNNTIASNGDIEIRPAIASQYFHKDGSLVPINGEILEHKPGIMEQWSESSNFLGKASYSFADAFYVTGQNLFTKNFRSDDLAFHLGGGVTSYSDNMDAFISAGTTFVPTAPAENGLLYMKNLNASQFSKLFKGTAVARLPGKERGIANQYLNKGFRQWNKWVPTGKLGNKAATTISKEVTNSGNAEEK